MAQYSYRILQIPRTTVNSVYLLRDDGYRWAFMLIEPMVDGINEWTDFFEYKQCNLPQQAAEIIRYLFRSLDVIPGDAGLSDPK